MIKKVSTSLLLNKFFILRLQQINKKIFSIKGNSSEEDINNILLQLKEVLEAPSVKKVCIDAKSLLKRLKSLDINLQSFDDISVMAYCVKTGGLSYNITDISLEFIESTFNPKSHDMLALYGVLEKKLFSQNQFYLYEAIERPAIEKIADMEIKGVQIDTSVLLNLSKEFKEKLIVLEKEIYKLQEKNLISAHPNS